MTKQRGVIKSAIDFVSESFANLWGGSSAHRYNSYILTQEYNAWRELDYLRAFLELPELNAVICTGARMFGNGIIKEVDSNGNEVKNSKLVDILNNPNWFQSGEEFRRQTYIWRKIFGNEYLFENGPIGVDFENAKSKALFTLPPNWMDVRYKETAPFFTFLETPDGLKYVICYEGKDIIIPKDTLIHLNDDRVSMKSDNGSIGYVGQSNYSMFKGESKCRALTPALNNLRMAYDTRGTLLKNRGALGILAGATGDKLGSMPLDAEERKRIQQEYSHNYGGLTGQSQLIVTASELKWQQMSINPDKMGLYTETAEDFNKIIDAYGSKRELFAGKDVTYENQKAAEKGVYIDSIIPDANEWLAGFNKKHRSGAKTKLIIDFFHLAIFQEDLELRGKSLDANINALSKALQDGAITLDQYKTELEKFGIKSQTLN